MERTSRDGGARARGKEVEAKKEETPKSNVRNTTRAEAQVKRCSRNASEKTRRTRDRERAGRTK